MIDENFNTYTKLVGVTAKNDSGINIQDILPILSKGGRLYFFRDYSNQYDKNAIKAYYFTKDVSIHIGYLNRNLAAEIAPFLDQNPSCDLEGIVEEILGGVDKTYGCNIRIWIQSPDEPSYEEIKAFQEYYADNKNTSSFENIRSQSETPIEKTNDFNKKKDPRDAYDRAGAPISIFFITLISILIAIGVVFYILILSEPTNSSNTDIISDTLITLDEYKMLKTGMTRTDVYYIVGSYGEKVSETGQVTDDYHIEMYSYDGYGVIGANAQLMFTNGELDTMAQYGLREYDNESDIETVESNISADDFEFNYTLPPADILGYYDIDTTCNNKSQYNIYNIFIEAKVNSGSEEITIYCGDIIKLGEISDTFDSIRTSTIPITDYEILNFTVKIKSEEGNFYYFEHDYITNTSRVF